MCLVGRFLAADTSQNKVIHALQFGYLLYTILYIYPVGWIYHQQLDMGVRCEKPGNVSVP